MVQALPNRVSFTEGQALVGRPSWAWSAQEQGSCCQGSAYLTDQEQGITGGQLRFGWAHNGTFIEWKNRFHHTQAIFLQSNWRAACSCNMLCMSTMVAGVCDIAGKGNSFLSSCQWLEDCADTLESLNECNEKQLARLCPKYRVQSWLTYSLKINNEHLCISCFTQGLLSLPIEEKIKIAIQY